LAGRLVGEPKSGATNRHRGARTRNVALDRAMRCPPAKTTVIAKSNPCCVRSQGMKAECKESPGGRTQCLGPLSGARYPDAPRLGNLGTEGSRRRPGVRRARLDAGPLRSSRARARLRNRARISVGWHFRRGRRGRHRGVSRFDRRHLSRVPAVGWMTGTESADPSRVGGRA
jgi:hypothetical protein